MTDKEKVIKEISERYEYWRKKEFERHSIESECRMSECQHLMLYISSVFRERSCYDLEEEVKVYIANNGYDGLDTEMEVQSIASHFANWQREKMMRGAIPAKVVNDEMSGCVVDCDNGCLVMPQHAYKMTDKLKIIIIKEE